MPSSKIERVVVISHDAFGRWSLVRKPAPRGRTECGWCGQKAKWLYGTLDDGLYSQPSWDKHVFCSIGCRRSYFL